MTLSVYCEEKQGRHTLELKNLRISTTRKSTGVEKDWQPSSSLFTIVQSMRSFLVFEYLYLSLKVLQLKLKCLEL
jgi:hypothetical protein